MDVLFVDDERSVLEQAKLFLEEFKDGLKVETSESARDALDKIKMKRYDAVVSDYLMPEMNGLDFLEKLRHQGEDIPFLVLTGKGGEQIAMEALNEGADFYLTKMGDPRSQYENLAESIEKVVNRKKARRELEEKFDLLLNNAPEGIIINDEYGNILYVNDFILEMLGYSEEDLSLMNMADLDLILSAETVEGYYWNRMEMGDNVSIYTKYGREDMTDVDVKLKSTKIIDEGKTFVINFVEELSELRESDRFKIFFEEVPDIGFIIDENGILENINKSFCKITGYPKEKLMGRRVESLLDLFKIEDFEIIEEKLIKFRQKEKIEPFVIKMKDELDNDRYVRIESNVINIGGRDKLFGVAFDITERVETEDRADFLHSLLTHDIKNKTQVLKGYLELLGDTELSERQEELVSKADKALKKSVQLVKKVDTLMKISGIEKKSVRLRPIIDTIVSELEPKADREDIEIDFDLDDVYVLGDSLLEDMFSNVIINSIVHSQGSKMQISYEDLDGYIKVIIEDDGIGIADDLKEIIFQKNSRKGKFAGTGLGMYIAKKIADNLEGDISVKDSELGGARFDVVLKKAEE